ncbi:MAG: hypothetical protein L0229_14535 [Blastocatellia bacterium]|nr:hypothetical protein [Blastocatellia bacterium]
MSAQKIPEEVREQVDEIVAAFNRKFIKDSYHDYVTRYKGSYLYLDRFEYGHADPICRLKYTGKMDEWEFAIYRYSGDRYDPDEWFFPGSEYVDGTIEGAMKAGLEAYP